MDTPTAPTPTSHFFTSLRTRLHYLDWGNSSAPTVVLVHGGLDHARSWDWTARALCRDYHVVALDMRGHGDSAWSAEGSYMIQNYVYDLAQLIDILGRDPVCIVGHSLGGSVTLRYAGLFPDRVRRIVAIEGLGMAPARIEQQLVRPHPELWREWIDSRRASAKRQPRRYTTIEAAVARMRERNDRLSVEQALHLTVHGVNRNEDGSYSWKFDPYLHGESLQLSHDEDLPEFWSRIECPVLLCLGLESWASNPTQDGRATHFRDSVLATFEGAGHWVHHDRFDQFAQALRDFL
ncbi:MAG: alpha/beta fold hydrolase [Sphingobium sp.]